MLNTPLRTNGVFILDNEGKKIAEAIDSRTALALVQFVNATAAQ